MELLLRSTRIIADRVGGKTPLGKSGEREYLLWMVDTVEGTPDFPDDKKYRWLGYVTGAAFIGIGGVTNLNLGDMLDIDPQDGVFPDQGACERPLRTANYRVVKGLMEITAAAKKSRAVDPSALELVEALLAAASIATTAARMSFDLGFTQAVMTACGLIDVASERDRTRPIYHEAYAACGFVIPKSRSKD